MSTLMDERESADCSTGSTCILLMMYQRTVPIFRKGRFYQYYQKLEELRVEEAPRYIDTSRMP